MPNGSISSSIFDRSHCLALLGTQSFGRLVFTDRALPDVLPVGYLLDGERVLIWLETGSRAAAAANGAVVAFEADDFDSDSQTGWSVTLVGHAQEISATDDVLDRMASDPDISRRTTRGLFCVSAEKITGRELSI